MRSKTLRWIVLSSAFVMSVIVLIQLYWLNMVYSFEQQKFNVNVVKSIRGLFEDVELTSNPVFNLQTLIEHPKENYFVFKVDTLAPVDTITYYLKLELEDFDVLTDAYLGIHQNGQSSYSSVHYLPTVASNFSPESNYDMTHFNKPYTYLAIYFPHRRHYVLSQMLFWFVSAGALIVVLIALAISLFYFYREKFLSETQKDFVNNFTHEFKTPLAVMKIASDVLIQEDIIQKPERLKNYTKIIQQQTDHLQQQVERLLKTANSEEKQLPLDRKPVSLQTLVLQAVKKIQPLIDEKKAVVDYDWTGDEIICNLDESHLELALINLLENALKYSTQPFIRIRVGREMEEVFIEIKDNGIGIEKKYLTKIFRKFYRVPTGNIHDVKGFGLGLDFVKRVVDAHKGRILVQSEPGIGTTFKILLPLS